MKNRLAVTTRFNIKKQNDLRWLSEFYDFADPKQTLELAFDQLLIATRQLANKLKEQQNASDQQGDGGAGSTGSTESGTQSVSEPVSDGGANGTADSKSAVGD